MAMEEYPVGDARAAKLWSKMLMVEAIKDTSIDGLQGESEDSVIQIMPETSGSKGDKVTFDLLMQPTGAGTSEGITQEGNEESLVTYTDAIYVNELGHAQRVPNKGTISSQRVPFEPREKLRSLLRDWWTDRIDTALFNQLCGNTAVTDTRYTGLQATTAPTISATAANNRWIFSEAGSTSTTVDTDLDNSGDEFTLAMIDKAVAMAKTVTPRIRPARIKGYPNKLFVAFLHPYQVYQLRQGSLGSTLTWAEIQKAVITAGEGSDNPIFKGGRALGIYNNTLLLENPHVTTGAVTTTPTANVRRAVFCGAQAAVMAYGKDYGPDKCNWVEEMFDYEREFGVRASMVFGIKKTIFNNIDFATIAMSSYSPAPA